MLNEGYNDVVLLIENEEVCSVSSILCVSNTRLKAIIKDEKAVGKISLPEKITRKAFCMLCRYYGYGMVEIDEENVCELLMCCICLDEENLLVKCKEFILSHLNNRVVVDILNEMNYLPDNYLSDIKTTICDYVCLNCISIFDDNIIFKKLHLDNINMIIRLENLLIPCEKYLLDKIIKHYHENIENIENKEAEYNEVLKNLNWKEIKFSEMSEKDLDIIYIDKMKKILNKEPIKRKFGRIPITENRMLNEMILNGMKDIDSIKDIYNEDCEYILSLDNTITEISNYLKESEYLLEIITILRIMKRLNVKMLDLKLEEIEKKRIVKLLIKEYEKENEKEEKELIMECISHLFDDSIYNNIVIK